MLAGCRGNGNNLTNCLGLKDETFLHFWWLIAEPDLQIVAEMEITGMPFGSIQTTWTT